MMESEEILTRFDEMRAEKEHFRKLFEQQSSLASERQMTIE